MISYNWWGQQWCKTIAQYADLQNRLERGRTYLRRGAIQEMDISGGKISARVQGTRLEPYKVDIDIEPLAKEKAEEIISRISRFDDLSNGNVPLIYNFLFSISKYGLFPNADEIHYSCSCPDWAILCKHVAAVLYSIGSILDQEPLMLFQLRGIDVDSLLNNHLIEETNDLLSKADDLSSDNSDILNVDDIADIFGILLDEHIEVGDQNNTVEQRITKEKDSESVRIIEIMPRLLSKEEKQIRKATAFQKRLEEEKHVIRQFSLDGIFVSEFKSFFDAAKKTNCTVSGIMSCCIGKQKASGGFQWREAEEDAPIQMLTTTVASSGFGKAVAQKDDDGNILHIFDSVASASRSVGVGSTSIHKVLGGERIHAGGYRWEYATVDQIREKQEKKPVQMTAIENEKKKENTEVPLLQKEFNQHFASSEEIEFDQENNMTVLSEEAKIIKNEDTKEAQMLSSGEEREASQIVEETIVYQDNDQSFYYEKENKPDGTSVNYSGADTIEKEPQVSDSEKESTFDLHGDTVMEDGAGNEPPKKQSVFKRFVGSIRGFFKQ